MFLFLKKTIPVEMQYYEETQNLIVMLKTEYPDPFITNTVIYRLEPYNNVPYSAEIIYDDQSYYNSIDRFSDTRFCAVGEMKSGGHSILSKDILLFSNNYCATSDFVDVSIVRESLVSGGSFNLSLYPLNTTNDSIIVNSKQYKIDCLH